MKIIWWKPSSLGWGLPPAPRSICTVQIHCSLSATICKHSVLYKKQSNAWLAQTVLAPQQKTYKWWLRRTYWDPRYQCSLKQCCYFVLSLRSEKSTGWKQKCSQQKSSVLYSSNGEGSALKHRLPQVNTYILQVEHITMSILAKPMWYSTICLWSTTKLSFSSDLCHQGAVTNNALHNGSKKDYWKQRVKRDRSGTSRGKTEVVNYWVKAKP